MLPAPTGTPYRSSPAVTAPYAPAGAAEFPNDNPDLHQGARWVCLSPRGPARALLRAPASPATLAPEALMPALEAPPSPFPPARREPPPKLEPPPVTRLYAGPLELDIDRIVLQHRVEDVPPPPDFIFRPLVSTRARVVLAAVPPLPIDPRPCRAVDAREECERVERGWRVDVAPCLTVGSSGEPSRRWGRRRGGVTACAAEPLSSEDAPLPLERAAASA
jgi:hypothetical protein